MDEVPLLQTPLLALDTSTHSPETTRKSSCARLAVVHAVRLAGLEHVELKAELRELGVAFELRRLAELLAPPPRGVARVQHEPALALTAATRLLGIA